MKFAVRKVVALLLAMLMLVSSMASFAEGTVEYSDTVSSYTLNPDTDAADEAIQEVYDEYIAELKAMTSYADRYAWLYSAKNEPASDLGDYFYADFIAYYNEKEPTGDAMCVCAEPLVYGADGHTEGCRWNINNLVTVPGASASSGSASVSGELPAGATLSASSKSTPAAFTGLFETENGAYADTQYSSFDLKIMVGDQQWQPGSKVSVTMSNVWSGEGTPAVYVYHFIDVASAIDSDCIISYDAALVSAYPEAAAAANEKGYANAVAYEVFSTIDGTATYNSNNVSFSLDSFSDVVVVSTGMESYYQLLYTFISREETMQGVSDYLATGKSVGAEEYYNDTYAGFVEWCKVNYPDGITLCNCTTFVYDENGAVIDCPPYQYDTTAHDATCPWHSDNINAKKTITDENGLASVTGNIPAGATLKVSEVILTPEMESIIDYSVFLEGTSEVKAYDIKILVDEEQWQPAEPVLVTMNGVLEEGLTNPVVNVYHVFDEADADGNTYEVFYSALNAVNIIDGESIAFYTNSFSNFYVTTGSTNSLATLADNNHNLYIAPGTSAIFTLSGNYIENDTVTITGATDGITAEYTSSNKRLIISAANANPGDITQIKVTWNYKSSTYGSTRTYTSIINVYVESSDDVVAEKDWNDKYKSRDVYLAIRQDGTIPGEPSVHGGEGYLFYTNAYVGAPQPPNQYPNRFSRSNAGGAEGIIKKDILKHESFRMNSERTSEGLPRNSGADLKAMVSGVNWDLFLLTAVKSSYASTIHINETKLTLADIASLTDEQILESYEIIPYVVKYENSGGWAWHIDCAVKVRNYIELSYNLNVPNDMSYPDSIGVPDTVTGPSPSTFPVDSIDGLTNGTMLVDGYYTFTFIEWNTSPSGNGESYNPNDPDKSSITIKEDTVLYAIWDSNPALGTGNLLIRKIVNGEEVDTTKEFTFKVDINDIYGNTSTESYEYRVFNADNLAAGISGTIKSGGTVTLKHGQYVVIYDVPAASEKDAEKEEGVDLTPNVTVTEQNVPDGYTNAWSGGTTATNPTTVKIEGGRRSELTCTNTKATPKVEVALKKLVEGNVGDRNKVFTFTVTSSDGTLTNKEYTLSHNSSAVKLPAVEVGATITIVESSAGYDTTASTTNTSNKVTKVDVEQNSDKTTATLDTITVTDDLSLITVTNTKDITVDTGILLDSAPYVLLLALVGAGIAFMIIRRRRRED